MTDTAMIQGAIERARGRTAAVHYLGTSSGGFATYSVGSSRDTDAAYNVTVRDEQYRCTCPSELRPACWHRSAVAIIRASRLMFGLLADGPNPREVA